MRTGQACADGADAAKRSNGAKANIDFLAMRNLLEVEQDQ
jgi:hypothetical protein